MLTRTCLALAALLAATPVSRAAAPTTPAAPTDSQLEQERERIDAQRKAMFDPRNPATQERPETLPSAGAVRREARDVEHERKQLFDPNNLATKNAPNSFPRISAPARSNVDIQALAKRYEGKAQARQRDGLMVFVSFTMPKASLQRAIVETNRAGGVVVLRGFKDGSIQATSRAINEMGASSGTVQINPKAFTQYRVKAVPAVVLVKPDGSQSLDQQGCVLPDKYVLIAGDVGLSYALEEIERSSPPFRAMAARYGRPLMGTVR